MVTGLGGLSDAESSIQASITRSDSAITLEGSSSRRSSRSDRSDRSDGARVSSDGDNPTHNTASTRKPLSVLPQGDNISARLGGKGDGGSPTSQAPNSASPTMGQGQGMSIATSLDSTPLYKLDAMAGGSQLPQSSLFQSPFAQSSQASLQSRQLHSSNANGAQSTHLRHGEDVLRLGKLISSSASNGKDSVQRLWVQLTPANLGKVHVELVERNGSLYARLLTDTPQAHKTIENNLQQLKDALAENGITLEELDLNGSGDGEAFADSNGANAHMDALARRQFINSRSSSDNNDDSAHSGDPSNVGASSSGYSSPRGIYA